MMPHNHIPLQISKPPHYKTGVMAGNHRQRKSSSSSFFSIFNIFKSNKNRGGRYYDAYDDASRARKVWPSDQDKGHWGAAEPGIDVKAEAFIKQYKKRVSESERFQIDPASAAAPQ